MASRRTRGPIDNYVINWGLLRYVWPNTSGRTTHARSARKFPLRQAHYGECHNNVYDTKYASASRSPLSRLPVLGHDQRAYHRQNAMLAARCALLFSCDLIFTPNLIGLLDTPLAHFLDIASLFHRPIMCTVVFFSETILAAYQTVLLGGMESNFSSRSMDMDLDEDLPISVRLAMCPTERERDGSGCRASDLNS